MMLHTKYQGSRPCGFREEDFSYFPNILLCRTCKPRDATHKISRLYALLFKTRRFFMTCKTCEPPDRPIFGPNGII